ncbi:ecdysoneless-like protein [Nymphaea thermarum]|nr:ecdysoneless-like protein [Nymphaea thermarum]
MAGKAISDENPLLCASERPRLPEDTVFYAIFPDQASQHPADQEAISVSLKELHVGILDYVASYSMDYIWQHEPFNLAVSPQSPNKACICVSLNPKNGDSEDGNARNYDGLAPPHLHGKVRYGDNVEDEWFVVFLMYVISTRYSSVSIRVWDTDGEFLLIEAAFSLPRWVKPENSSNRVFIRQGKLHLVPEQWLPSPTLSDSLRFLSSSSSDSETRAPNAVEAALERRIGVYPERARENMHRTRCRLPVAVAQVLKHEPQIISLAVEGFYDRDIDSMKFASRMEKFLSGGEMVNVSVRMSRAMYAQLVQQVFQAPKCYPMPPLSDIESFREAELGMKIACGFEMMYQQRRQYELGSGDGQRLEHSVSGHSFSGVEGLVGVNAWEAFVNSLNSKCYFRGLLPGSKEYQRLMDEALDYYRKTSLFSKTRKPIVLSWIAGFQMFKSHAVAEPLKLEDLCLAVCVVAIRYTCRCRG